ncbi:MAG: asparagine synthase (glutamine-hydrolyzing), partial [Cyanobacteria bacterium]|nr:asparagine synthase (glutamine-hydrolyzing) [Cyanobacteriota bacterium]
MCGIIGFAAREPQAVSRLTAALETVRHRGPDENGLWQSSDGCVGLGSTRLAIIGPENGLQPLHNEDGEISAVVNGEFYDFERIREQLKLRGHTFRTGSDSEIAIHLYEEHVEGFVEHLRGEFAIILWDNRAKKLIAVRDRFGIKPLCYAVTAGGIYLASEAKALFALGITASWDEESIYHVANTQYVLPDRTLFAGVNQLRPGHILTYDHNGVSIRTYWDLDYGISDDGNYATEISTEMVEAFSHAFEESVKLRLRSDVPVCFHLSGGLDSSSVLGTAARLTSKPLSAFSVCFEESSYDEQALAQEMADFVGASFHPIHVTDQELMDCLPDAVYHSEGLAVNGHLPAKYLLNRHIRKAGYKVALTGEGSDELLCGYAHLRTDLFRHTNREALVPALYETNTASQGIMLSHGQSLPLDSVSERLSFVPAFLEAKGSLGHKMRSILSSDFVSKFEG